MRYKIIETPEGFICYGEFPKTKTKKIKSFLWFTKNEYYYDDECEWYPLGISGGKRISNLRIGYFEQTAIFKSFDEAEKFIRKCKQGSKETIFE